MPELLNFVPDSAQRLVQGGRQVAGYAVRRASEQFGQAGARRNALQARIQNELRHLDGGILDCSKPWSDSALGHTNLVPQPRECAQTERSLLPKLERVYDGLRQVEQHAAEVSSIVAETLLKDSVELVRQVPGLPSLTLEGPEAPPETPQAPNPRQPDEPL